MKHRIAVLFFTVCALATASVQASSYELWVAGRLSSATSANGSIARFSAKDGSFLGYFMHTNNGSGLVVTPGAGTISRVATDNGKIYVGYLAATSYNKVVRYDRTGANPSFDFIPGPGGDWRFGSYYYPVRGLIFKADHIFLMAGVYTNKTPDMLAGTYLFRHNLDGTSAGTQPDTSLGDNRGAQLSGPTNIAPINGSADLAQDSSGNFLALLGTGVYRFAPDGSHYGPGGLGDTNAWITSSALSPLTVFSALAVDGTGRIYVAGDQNSVTTSLLLRFNANGTPAGTNGTTAVFAKYITYLKGVIRAQCLAIGPEDGYLYAGNGYVGSGNYENMINRFYTSGANDGKLVEEGGFANRGGATAPLYMPSFNIIFVKTTSSGTVIAIK
jgi:hypothetical protein